MSRFEGLVCANRRKNYSTNEICAALEIPSRTLRTCCKAHLGMGPLRYLRLRRMQLVRRALMPLLVQSTDLTVIPGLRLDERI